MSKTCTNVRKRRTADQSGNTLVEFALIAPLLSVLMLAAFDAGMYVTAFIGVQNAARAGALRNSGGSESATDQSAACAVVIDQLKGLPGSLPSQCGAAPLVVSSIYCAGAASCGTSVSSADGKPSCLVTVRYTLPSLFRFPLAGPSVIAISSQMKIRSFE